MGATAQLKKLQFKDRALQQFQQNVDDALRPILAGPLANAVLATYTTAGVLAGNSDFLVLHTLGRIPIGILALVPAASAFAAGGTALNAGLQPTMGAAFAFYQSPSVNSLPTTQIIMRCTGTLAAAVKLGFLVF